MLAPSYGGYVLPFWTGYNEAPDAQNIISLENIMSLGKQAKTLSKGQIDALLNHASNSRYSTRNRVVVLLSVRAGLRAKEISCLTWDMVTDADGSIGSAIHLQDKASKGRSGRVIPLNAELRSALMTLKREAEAASRPSAYVVSTERSLKTSTNIDNGFWFIS